MRKRLVLFVVLVMITLSSCMRAAQTNELNICGSYAVPGMYITDLKGVASPTTLEEDEQGRTLFKFTRQNSITGEEGTAIVICQHIDADYVYYYEDQCYIYNCNTEEDIAALKSQNDWGLPLDFNKMSIRPNKISFDGVIVSNRVLKRKDVRSAIKLKLANLQATPIEYTMLDVNSNGSELFWIKAVVKKGTTYYFAIIDTDYNIVFMPSESPAIIPSEIAAFKNDNGWYDTSLP